jgi:dolichol kinase
MVAATGTLGSFLACAIATRIPRLLVVQILALIVTPLLCVECVLHWYQSELSNPKCFIWLLDFLRGSESDVAQNTPRVVWIVYWVIVLSIMMPLSTHPRFVAPNVVMRKWFHLIAILLFTPVTVYAPQLMTLSYAVALCGLMTVECLRAQLPKSIQGFYLSLSDSDKDNPDRVIVSHMALICGCAFPLWLAVCVKDDSKLLKLWGVIVLGVGDSVAAIVGSYWGRTKWGWNKKRSLEGSLAMLISLAICCAPFGDPWIAVVVVFTTLLEAFTSQIDNMVLPLAGSGLLLLFISAGR